MSLVNLIPDATVLLAMPPEELGMYVLQAMTQTSRSGQMHIQTLYNDIARTAGRESPYPPQLLGEVEGAVTEAWQWLENQLLIVPEPGINGQNGFRRLGRRAKDLRTSEQFKAFRQGAAFPRALLHPAIAERVWIDVMRGEFEKAVFVAFKTVEVAVRETGAFPDTDIGVTLMRKAFHPETGPLTRLADPVAEREALQQLFAGAIGSYKNPHSHRNVTINEAAEAQEMVMLASHLLRIVDSRRPR
jgi:uncharacterized protein (TIGR02391 family)